MCQFLSLLYQWFKQRCLYFRIPIDKFDGAPRSVTNTYLQVTINLDPTIDPSSGLIYGLVCFFLNRRSVLELSDVTSKLYLFECTGYHCNALNRIQIMSLQITKITLQYIIPICQNKPAKYQTRRFTHFFDHQIRNSFKTSNADG